MGQIVQELRTDEVRGGGSRLRGNKRETNDFGFVGETATEQVMADRHGNIRGKEGGG